MMKKFLSLLLALCLTLGLLPGGGGITRLVRMFGIQEALTGFLLEGRRLKPAEALERGLGDEVVESADELVPAAIAWRPTAGPADTRRRARPKP